MAAMGAMPGGGGSPDDLLQQIIDLCTQYVQGGGDPNQLMDALAQSWQGSPPDDQGGMPPDDGSGLPPDAAMAGPSAPPSSNDGQHPFADASAMAIEDMKKKSKAGY
jgi:hypothetical protein